MNEVRESISPTKSHEEDTKGNNGLCFFFVFLRVTSWERVFENCDYGLKL